MSNTSKYDLFMEEIVSLEKMVQRFVVESQELRDEKSDLKSKVENLEKENEVLVLKIQELEKKLSKAEDKTSALGEATLDFNDRQNFKSQIDDLIERIDYHIRS